MLTEQEREWVTGVSFGAQVRGGLPEGVVAELGLEHRATPQRLAQAEHLFTRAELSDFESYGSRGKLRHRETGQVYVVAQDQVLMATDAAKSGVEFYILHAGDLLFLRPRGWDGAQRGAPGAIVSGQLRQSASGAVRIVDSSGATVDGLTA